MNLILLICLFILAWLWQNISHELSHALFAWLKCKIKPSRIIIFPHWVNHDSTQMRFWRPWEFNKPWPKARFIFARVIYDGFVTNRIVSFAPHFGALLTFTISLFIFGISNSIMILPFMICPIIDILFWWYGFFFGSRYCDGKKFRKYRS